MFGMCIALALIRGRFSFTLSLPSCIVLCLDQTMNTEIITEIPSEDCKEKVKKVCCLLDI